MQKDFLMLKAWLQWAKYNLIARTVVTWFANLTHNLRKNIFLFMDIHDDANMEQIAHKILTHNLRKNNARKDDACWACPKSTSQPPAR